VKGTTGGPATVTVTYNEVRAAEGDKDHLLVIVHGVALGFGPAGDLRASDGTLTVHDPWLPKPGELTPINYRWHR
jgi:hypothetical protein